MNTIVSLNAASSAKSAHAALAAQKQLAGAAGRNAANDKARQASEDFEAVYLNTMFSQMFTAMDGEGPFGGGKAVGVWRSFLTDEYSKSFARKGGVGIAPEVYRSLMAQQEDRGTASAVTETKP
jgi:Rod binding domain-containing protein